MKFRTIFSHTLDLVQIVIRHVIRAKLVYLVFLFSLLSQIGGLKLIQNISIVGVGVPVLKIQHTVYIAMFLELFGGVLLCVVYGIWVVPYLHSSSRAQLTLVLPIKKSAFACSSALGLLALLLVQYMSLILVFGCVMGIGELAPSVFPWQYFFLGAILETLCFVSLMFFFAFLSVSTGPVTAFFLGVMVLSGLQFWGVVKAFGTFLASKGVATPTYSVLAHIYDYLLPVGELVFQLKIIGTPGLDYSGVLIKWGVWLLIMAGLYTVSISRIRRFKSSI